MYNKMIEDFVRWYGAKVHYCYGRNSVFTSDRVTRYHADNGDTVEIELSASAFEQLVDADNKSALDYQTSREEARMRSQYPALETAYSKYKMLLDYINEKYI